MKKQMITDNYNYSPAPWYSRQLFKYSNQSCINRCVKKITGICPLSPLNQQLGARGGGGALAQNIKLGKAVIWFSITFGLSICDFEIGFRTVSLRNKKAQCFVGRNRCRVVHQYYYQLTAYCCTCGPFCRPIFYNR